MEVATEAVWGWRGRETGKPEIKTGILSGG
jgi:hypothetical protein